MTDKRPQEEFPHVVNKPWGREVWLEVNDKYCFKELFLNPLNRTSLQYHKVKRETLYVVSGILGILLENEEGGLEEKFLEPGDSLTIVPPRKHRAFTLGTAAHYLEASYPDVDDIVRIQDDSGRGDGRVESEHLK